MYKQWYKSLEQDDKVSVDKKVRRIRAAVKSRGRTQFSEDMARELIYVILKDNRIKL